MDLVEEKIQLIAKEMQESNASQWTITKIIKDLSELDTKSETKLRKIALEKLKEMEPEAGQTYEAFSKMKVFTSNENIENFDRGNIIKSLMKETSISRTVAEKVTIEVENQIKDSKIDLITTSLIRELVNSKLISYGFEKIRNEYTRLGEPVFDIKNKMLKEPYANEQTREYNLLHKIPKKLKEKHFNGEIFIEDITGFSTRAYAYAFISEKKDTLEKTVIDSVKKIIENEKYFFCTPNLYGLTFVTAPFIKKEIQLKKTVRLINDLFTIPKNFVNSLELFTPTKLADYSEYRIKAVELSNLLLEQKNSIIQIDSKYCLKLIEMQDKSFLILNNSDEEYFALNNNLFSPTQGIDFFVNINLEKIDFDDEENFFTEFDLLLEEIIKLKEIKQKELNEKKYLQKFNISEMKTGIGLTNIFSTMQKVNEKKTKEFSNKLYKKLTSYEELLLFGLSSNKAKQRFEQATGREIFSHDAMSFDECLQSKKCCFTGNATTIKEINELIEKKVKQIYYNGKQKQENPDL